MNRLLLVSWMTRLSECESVSGVGKRQQESCCVLCANELLPVSVAWSGEGGPGVRAAAGVADDQAEQEGACWLATARRLPYTVSVRRAFLLVINVEWSGVHVVKC